MWPRYWLKTLVILSNNEEEQAYLQFSSLSAWAALRFFQFECPYEWIELFGDRLERFSMSLKVLPEICLQWQSFMKQAILTTFFLNFKQISNEIQIHLLAFSRHEFDTTSLFRIWLNFFRFPNVPLRFSVVDVIVTRNLFHWTSIFIFFQVGFS